MTKIPDHLGSVTNTLGYLASERVIQRGRQCYLDQRVIRLDYIDSGIAGDVLSSSRNTHYQVSIVFDHDRPEPRCTCLYDYEDFCKHAVALLLEAVHRRGKSEHRDDLTIKPRSTSKDSTYFDDLAAIEIERRKIRGALDIYELIETPGQPIGSFLIRSKISNATYRIHLRDHHFDFGTCTCADYLTNELNTCKHIERLKIVLPIIFRPTDLSLTDGLPFGIYRYPRSSGNSVYEPVQNLRIFHCHDRRNKLLDRLCTYHDANGFFRYHREIDLSGSKKNRTYLNEYMNLLEGIESEVDGFELHDQVKPLIAETIAELDATMTILDDFGTLPMLDLSDLLPSAPTAFLPFLTRKNNLIRLPSLSDSRDLAFQILAALTRTGLIERAVIVAKNDQVEHLSQLWRAFSSKDRGKWNDRTQKQTKSIPIDFIVYGDAALRSNDRPSTGKHRLILFDNPDPNWRYQFIDALRYYPAEYRLLTLDGSIPLDPESFRLLTTLLDEKLLGPSWRYKAEVKPLDDDRETGGVSVFPQRLQRFFIGILPDWSISPIPDRSEAKTPLSSRRSIDRLSCDDIKLQLTAIIEALPELKLSSDELTTLFSLKNLPVRLIEQADDVTRLSIWLKR